MAYQTGTASGPKDLLAKIKTFAANNGWTINRDWSAENNDRLLVSSGDQHVALSAGSYDSQAVQTGIRIRGATGVDTSAAWDAQPGSSPTGIANRMPGPYSAYHLFGNSQYIHCVAEINAGVFKHLVFGGIDKFGSFTGGAYVGALYWHDDFNDTPVDSFHSALFDYSCFYNKSCFVRADIDGATDNWARFTRNRDNDYIRAAGPARDYGFCAPLYRRSPNTVNGVTPLLPVYILLERPSQFYSPAGTVPDMAYCNCENIAPGGAVTVGQDTWRVFPFIQKNDPDARNDGPNSGHYAWAYKQVD